MRTIRIMKILPWRWRQVRRILPLLPCILLCVSTQAQCQRLGQGAVRTLGDNSESAQSQRAWRNNEPNDDPWGILSETTEAKHSEASASHRARRQVDLDIGNGEAQSKAKFAYRVLSETSEEAAEAAARTNKYPQVFLLRIHFPASSMRAHILSRIVYSAMRQLATNKQCQGNL